VHDVLTDFVLASLHHLLVFGLVAMLVAEAVLLRGAFDRGVLQRLAGIDRGYGICAMLLIVVGIGRIVYGIKGHDFYLHNPWFHAKMGAFVLVGLLSILPTVRFLRWRKALAANPAYLPDSAEVAKLRGLVRFELVLLAAIFVLAAGMARYGGL
jgi:putative membrane protein